MNKTKEITLSTGKWLSVAVPKEAEGLEVSIQPDNIPCLSYWYKDNLDPEIICLPEGHTYTLIGKASELTEDQWKGIVEMLIEDVKIEWDVLEGWQYGNVYQNYSDEDRPVYTAAESGLSLLLLYGLNPTTTLILKID